ncbi:hypothetical protein RHS01_01331 [Rhizoctonia solani]|uniref:Uncharacterized protein n=1 Tax=Rhizoctonia solani TaxID=456999 RepID=A0A8H7IK69_9AGAM|nr:hypothetical protein RHS01_01331 [Rhizoctonia solani]
MSIRSTTGCYACKSRRKKCDEAKPSVSVRVPGAYREEHQEENKTCTKTPKRTAEKLQKEKELHLATASKLHKNANAHTLSALFDQLFNPSLCAPLSPNITWDDIIQQYPSQPQKDTFSLDPLTGQALLLLPDPNLVPQGSMSGSNLTSGQAILFDALFSLGEIAHPSSCVDSDGTTYRNSSSETDELEEADIKFVRHNLLAFALQSYAQWIPLTVFEPLTIVNKTKQALIDQLAYPTSRSRILLISQIMSSLSKSWVVEEHLKQMIGLLVEQISVTLTGYTAQNSQCLANEAERQRANSALDNTLERSPARNSSVLAAFPPPHPPHLTSLLSDPRLNTRLFAGLDIVFSVATGNSTFGKYHVPRGLQLREELEKMQESYGLRWLCGMPDQYIMLVAYMDELKEDGNATEDMIQQIEDYITNMRIAPPESKDPMLRIGRMVVQECWREAMHIYLYMALCGVPATDTRVKRSVRSFIGLLNNTNPHRNTDTFAAIPTVIAGVASIRASHRQVICSRILQLPDCAQPNTAGSDLFRMVQDVWARTSLEGRAARWGDLREACRRITGV